MIKPPEPENAAETTETIPTKRRTPNLDRIDAQHDDQAAHLIEHGHWNPMNSIQGYPFLQDHFELGMWPVSLLSALHPNGLLLLWIQDAAIVGTELVTFIWIVDLLDRARQRRGLSPEAYWLLALAALALILLQIREAVDLGRPFEIGRAHV